MDKEEPYGLTSAIRILLAKWRYPVIGAIVCAVAAAMFASLRPNRFETRATLVLQPPPFKEAGKQAGKEGDSDVTALIPKTMQVSDYAVLLNCDAVLHRLASAMRMYSSDADGFMVENLRGALSVTTHTTGRDTAGAKYSPVIELVAVARSAELAARLANTWATVAEEMVAEATGKTKQDSTVFLEDEHGVAQKDLLQAESSQQQSQDLYAQQITEISNETQKLVADLQDQSAHQLDELTDKWDTKISELEAKLALDRKETELSAKLAGISKLEDELATVKIQMADMSTRLSSLQGEIQQHPELRVLSKAITDNALWMQVTKSDADKGGGLPEALRDKELRSEEINPIHDQLSLEMADVRIVLDSLPKREKQLLEAVQSIRDEYDALLADRAKASLLLEQADRQKELEIEILRRDTDVARMQLEEDRKTKLAILKRDADLKKTQLDREVTSQKGKFDVLATKYLSARFAQADKSTDIVQIGEAAPPAKPLHKSRLLLAFLGLAVGVMLGAGYVIAEDFVRRVVPALSQ